MDQKNNVRVIILAAGKGTRLRPITNDVPKCMVKVRDRALLEWQLDVIEASGITDIITVTGYKEDKIKDSRVVKVYNERYASTNMIYSLFCAEEYMEGDLIVAYGDIVYSKKVLQRLINNPNDIVIACDEEWDEYWSERFDDPLSDAETFKKGAGNRVESLGGKPKDKRDIEGQYIGLIKFSAKGIASIKKEYHRCMDDETCFLNAWNSGRNLENSYMTDLLNYMAAHNEVHYQSIERGWIEVDDHSDLKIAERYITSIVS